MNAHCERFNRAIQESFIDYHEDLLFTDLDGFNQELADWLVFYNTERPHRALALLSPMQSLIINQPECHMLWTYTLPYNLSLPGPYYYWPGNLVEYLSRAA